MTQILATELSEHPPIQCLLEMRCDGLLTITRQPGCSQADALDMLRFLTNSNGPFDHLTILPEPDEDA